jgi:6-phosphogluconolactonase
MILPASAPELVIAADRDELLAGAAEEVLEVMREAVRERGRCSIALAGGSTPRGLYRRLAATHGAEVPWEALLLFFGDERVVPPYDVASNYRMVRETLLSHERASAAVVHRVPTELATPQEAADAYEHTLRSAFELDHGELPGFDLVLLGLGADGHTASLFPGVLLGDEPMRLVAAPFVPAQSAYRITLTLPVFTAAARVLFVVSGPDKAEAVLASLGESEAPPAAVPPARLVRPVRGRLRWRLDRDAARLLAAD